MTTDRDAGGMVVRVAEATLSRGERLAREAVPREHGGVLLGWWEADSVAVVAELLSVPDPAAGPLRYRRRHAPAQARLDEYLLTRDDPRCGYIGEWHSHPAPQGPSRIDRAELSALVRQTGKPVALIVLALRRGGGLTVHGLVGRPRRLRRAVIEIASIERLTP